MIRLTVTEKTYKKDSNFRQLSKDENKSLLCSVDIEDDTKVPVKEDVPGEWFFTRDFTCRFYKCESTATQEDQIDEPNVYDFQILEDLREMARYDAKELRYWFHDVPPGKHILEVSYSEPDSDDQYLEFNNTYPEEGRGND